MMPDSRLLISCIACCSWPVSEPFVTSISLVRSPAAIRSACSTACWIGDGDAPGDADCRERGQDQSDDQEQQCDLRPTA